MESEMGAPGLGVSKRIKATSVFGVVAMPSINKPMQSVIYAQYCLALYNQPF